jgi:hypothetical protein
VTSAAAPDASRTHCAAGYRDVELDRHAEEPGRFGVAFPVGPEPGAVGRGLPDGGLPVPDDVRQVAEPPPERDRPSVTERLAEAYAAAL